MQCSQAPAAVGDPWAQVRAALAFPPPERRVGSRIEHITVEQPGLLSEVVAQSLGMPLDLVLELLRFGAVYTCRVLPALPPERAAGMTPQAVARAQAARQAGREAAASRDPSLDVPKRAPRDARVERHAFVRVHCHPKRFPAAYAHDWRARVVRVGADFVAVSKPACVPTAPTSDNLLESAPALTAAALGLGGPLLITSRLDHCTEGLVLLARRPAAAALFNRLQASVTPAGEACVRKHYRALSAAAPPLGPLVHYLAANRRRQGLSARTRVFPDASGGGKRSELVVHSAQRVQLTGAAAARWGPAAWESLVELRTGRTHQIRAQLAAVGAPLCGDSLYGVPEPPEGALAEGQPRPMAPTDAIGLQCAALRVCNLHMADDWKAAPSAEPAVWQTFEAGSPWWRD